ncbi:MAG TPA: ABC transporter ATP-binding protein [Planctomycetota bacterium]|nr:ABC transporter ATP-binding protein [Planctomycetota bacterium]
MRVPSIAIKNVTRRYGEESKSFWAVRGITLDVYPGEVTVLMGPSGSGKTTLLSMLGGVLAPTSGSIGVCGTRLDRCDEDACQRFRRSKIGFIFQNFNLLSSLTALENIAIALSLRGADSASAEAALDSVGLASKAGSYPHELSGGQRQRVGIARALAGDPPVLLADEPTAALDAAQGRRVMQLLRQRTQERGTTVIVVTHDPRVREFSDRVIEMEDGRITKIVRRVRPEQAGRQALWTVSRSGNVVAEVGGI